MVQDGVVVLDGVCGAGALDALGRVVVVVLLVVLEAALLAVDLVVAPQRELVARDQLALTRGAPEALRVVDPALGAHHVVRLAERAQALVTLVAEQPGWRTRV